MEMANAFSSLMNALTVLSSKTFIYLYRWASLNRSFRILLKNVPLSVLEIGNKVAARSMEKSFHSQPKKGSIALAVQSGSLRIIMLNQMAKEGIGLSKLKYYYRSKNEEIESKILDELCLDPETRVIVFVIESMSQARQFMLKAKEVNKKKPIIILKGGHSKAGASAVLSHVGSLAGSDEIWKGALRQSGILRAQTIEETIDFAKSLSMLGPLYGDKVGIITNGGGAGIIAADACVTRGLEVPELALLVQKSLAESVALFSGVTNPLDLRVLATAEMYKEAIATLFGSNCIDVLLLIVCATPALDVDKLVDVILEQRRRHQKPILVCVAGSDEFVEHFHSLKVSSIPVYLVPERAAAGVAASVCYGKLLKLQKNR
jgi:acyl-CoA synthetase (NDP forming)